jgi:DNA polymerase-4
MSPSDGKPVSTQPRKIIHIDMDAFYASVEQRDNPELRGKPVAVGGSRERGVVDAASYEARKFGVRSAMPSITAKRQCPTLIFVKPRFEVYKQISQQIRSIFAEHTPIIEPLARRGLSRRDQEPSGYSACTRHRAEYTCQNQDGNRSQRLGGHLLQQVPGEARLRHRKSNGQYVIAPEAGVSFVEILPVGKFYGIGPATAAKFNALGIRTGLDIRNQTLTFLEAHFGKSGTYYYWISRGIDERPVRANRIRKSIGA